VNTAPVFSRILRYGAILAGGVAVVGSVVGWLVDNDRGIPSALIGAAIAFLFLGVTAASILLAGRVTKWDILHPAFLSIVMGGWLLKFVAFIVILVLLKDQPWINPLVLFLSVIVAVIGSLVIDMVVIARSRIPLVEIPPAPVDGP
jgi:hypothetical protein